MQSVVNYIKSNYDRYLEELKEFCAIPSVSARSEHAGDLQRCAEWVADQMKSIGLDNIEICPTAGYPIVYADWLHAPGKPTLLFYGHYDVQPAEPLELWESPPWDLTLRKGDLYARGVVDDKGQVFMHLKALEAFMKQDGKLPVNVKFMIEGEEEVGSENIEKFVRTERKRLACDALVVSDTTMLGKGIPSVCYGLRGLCYFEVEFTGPTVDLHSGSFGGAVPNPINLLCEMMAKLHDKDGRVAIPGFYKAVRPVTKQERKQIKALPFSEKRFQKTTGAKKLMGEKGYSTVERIWARPTLDVNGIYGGYTGEGAKTVISSKASAKFSTRLVADQDPKTITKLVKKHIEKLTPKSVKMKFTVHSEGDGWIAPFDHPLVQAGKTALEKGFKKKAVFIREGGSIPLVSMMYTAFKKPCVLLGFGLPDENAHAPNERLNLENFQKGILSLAYYYDETGRANGTGPKKGKKGSKRRR
jgi:acetylornithine deacetylase/succinyl-diaminopimelate desuccinylase-like protein